LAFAAHGGLFIQRIDPDGPGIGRPRASRSTTRSGNAIRKHNFPLGKQARSLADGLRARDQLPIIPTRRGKIALGRAPRSAELINARLSPRISPSDLLLSPRFKLVVTAREPVPSLADLSFPFSLSLSLSLSPLFSSSLSFPPSLLRPFERQIA